MTKKPTKLKDYKPWAAYRRAYDEKAGDPEVARLRTELKEVHERATAITIRLNEAEAPYDSRLLKAADAIRAAVLEHNRSITSNGVTGKPVKGRTSTSWKKVAVAAGADPLLIEEHTKVGPPKVKIEVLA